MVKPVDVDVLSALLRRAAEMPDLEYKSTWNPGDKRDLVELCKDFAAMESLPDGGYVVVGANDDGSPSGTFSPANPRDYDEQKIRSKVVKVLGEPLDLSASLLVWENSTYLLIGIGPHQDGLRIMTKDAGHEGGDVWRESDVFVRRGTSSVRWNQHEARGILERIVAVRKEEWRKDIFETIRQASPNLDGAGYVNLTTDIPVDSFTVAATELIRRQDAVGLDTLVRRITNTARGIVEQARANGDVDNEAAAVEVQREFDRLNIVAVLTARYGLSDPFTEVMESYRTIYSANDDEYMQYPSTFVTSHRLVMTSAMALGAALVNEKRWQQIYALARLAPTYTHNGYWTSLLRKAEVMAARSTQARQDEDLTRSGVIADATPIADHLFALLDETGRADTVTLLVQFDVLRGIATTDPEDSRLGAYPNFSFYRSARAEPAFLAVLDDDRARSVFSARSDDELRSVFQLMDQGAQQEGMMYHGWHGFQNPRLARFVDSARN
ncbi:helix-turn-helix domain-containing protein [Curtobacterium sp. NPDC089689]|uniref:AlbA family DNA-binding domain-containing protein n=1 Tax=Curtobacterium sp. NPDC089689 TaxID=3363968 RepID=UPI0037FB944F